MVAIHELAQELTKVLLLLVLRIVTNKYDNHILMCYCMQNNMKEYLYKHIYVHTDRPITQQVASYIIPSIREVIVPKLR